MNKYDYLKKYIGPHNYPVKIWQENSFLKVTREDIINVEKKMSIILPNSLKEFWLNIGCGHLTVGKNKAEDYENSLANKILSPEEISSIFLGKEDAMILPEAVEYIEEGYIKGDDIIFFEIGDMSSFLVMKPSSNKPDAIYDMLGFLIEEHFEKFIWRLYHESPDYYLDVYSKQSAKYDLSLDQLAKLYEEDADLDEPIQEVAQIFSMDPSIVKRTLADHIRDSQRK